MKNDILILANSKLNSPDHELNKLCKLIIKNINNFNCYYCLDTKKTWQARSSAFANLDGRGRYDIMHCNKCGESKWISCSSSNNIKSESGIKIFRTDNVTTSDIFDELKKIYHHKVLEDDAEWFLYERDNIMKKITSVDMQVKIKDLANAVSASLQIYAGNIPALLNQVKNLTINISMTMNETNDCKELIKTYNVDNRNYYLLFKMEKSLKKVNCLKSCFSSESFIFNVTYIILSPKNNVAKRRCEEIMNDNIESKIDNLTI